MDPTEAGDCRCTPFDTLRIATYNPYSLTWPCGVGGLQRDTSEMHVSAAEPEEMGDEDISDSQWQNKTTMAEMGMPLETNVKVNENVIQNQTVRPAEGGYSTQDYRSESMTFEIIPGATPAGSEADCHPNGLDDCQRPAAGQPARKIVQIDSDGSDKDTESEMINISELSTLNANAVPWIPAGKGQAMQSPTDCEVDKDKWVKVEEVDKRHRGAQEGCTKKLRQEVSMLTGIPFPAGHFQHLEHLVAAIRLMRTETCGGGVYRESMFHCWVLFTDNNDHRNSTRGGGVQWAGIRQ